MTETNEQGSRVGRIWCWLGWHHWVSWPHYFADELTALTAITWVCTRRGCKAGGGYDY